jgi:protein SCO1/2
MKCPIALPLLLLATACGQAGSPAQKTYPLRGQVLAVRTDVREVRISHEEIPGYMAAMTMSFGVRDAAELAGLGRGDLVAATLVVTDTDAWLIGLQKVGHAEVEDSEADASGSASAPARPAPELLEPGQAVPDEAFVDQNGQPFSLAAARGKAVALTFIYTRCPLPNFCPRMDRHFLAAQRLVATRPSLKDRVQFVSVSFDPAFDTPPVMKQHMASLGADASSWRFVTADQNTIERFATRFGVSIVRENADRLEIVHNLRTAILAPDGRLVTILNGGDWTPEQLVSELAATLTS